MMSLAAEKHGDRAARHVQARRRVGRGLLPRGGRDRQRDRARADRPRHRRATASPCCARPARVDVRELRHHERRRPSSSRSTPRTRPRSASGWPATPSRASRRLRGREPGRQDRAGPRPPARARGDHRHRPGGDVGDAISLDDLRERGRGRDAAEVAERAAAVSPDDPYTIIYTSGTTGPPKGCVLTHGNYRAVVDDVRDDVDPPGGRRRLPLPPARALVRAADPAARRSTSARTIAYFGGDPKQIVPELMPRSSRPTCRRCRGSSRRSTRWSPRPTTRRRSRPRASSG